MNLCQIRKILQPQAPLRYSQLVWQFPNSRPPHSHLPLFLQLPLDTQGVGTTCVCPHAWEGYLFVCSFLEEEGAVVGAEEEDGECSVEETLVDVGH